MVGRRQSSPLFPYPTLFRSVDVERRHAAELRAAGLAGGVGGGLERVDRLLEPHLLGDRQRRDAAGPGLDRKSTRLNSSHGYISYAVFCLKKKKNDHGLLDAS